MRTSLRLSLATSAVVAMALPIAAFALEGTGPRVTVTGTVMEVNITEKQKFDQVGAEIVMKAQNGQIVTIVVNKDTEIVSEGKLSRKLLIPANIQKGRSVRVRGWRLGTDSMTASLFLLLNVETDPLYSANGIIQSISGKTVTVLTQNGQSRTFTLTNETEVNISYTLYGSNGLSLIGKQALLTMNPNDPSLIRIIRVTGEPQVERGAKPATVKVK
jgi:hypothetical protein